MADEHQNRTETTSPATEVAPAEAPAEPRVYTAAEQRAAIFERTGARDMGDFHPHAPPREPEPEQPTEAPTETAETVAPPAPQQPTEQPRDELQELRAQVAALQAKLSEPDEKPPEPEVPKDPDHPLAAHARQILGQHATPKHIGRASLLLEQRYQWQQFARHHEAVKSDESAANKAKAERAMAVLDQQIEDLAETVALHAKIAAMEGEFEQRSKPAPRDEAEKLIDSAFSNREALGKTYPNFVRALESDLEYGAEIKAQMLAMPMDDPQAWLESAERLLVISERALLAAAPKQPATQPPAQPAAKGETVPKPPATAQPQPGERYPVRPSAPIGQEDQIYSRKDFWGRVNEGVTVRGRAH